MSSRPRVLLVEDDATWQEIYRRCLIGADYEIVAARRFKAALTMLEEQSFDVILTDLKMFGGSEEFPGFSILERARRIDPEVQVIVITGYGSADHALRAMGSGAYDYITKDRELRRKLPLTVQSALEVRALKQELLGSELRDDTRIETDRIIGNSASMQALFERVARAAENSTNVLIYGEVGTGKRLIAQTIHRQSSRKGAPFWVIECGGLSESLLESEFFGYEIGARYPGSQLQPGKFERANGGTIFLDCVNDLNVHFQTRLLSILSENQVTRIGGQEFVPVNVRIITSTSEDLEELMQTGQFRRALFDILNETSISVPPLRSRKDGDDILALAAMFLQRHMGSSQVIFSAEAATLLSQYNYPGNVRELESIVKQALAVCKGEIIKPEHLRPEIRYYHQPRKVSGSGEKDQAVEMESAPEAGEYPEPVDLSKLRQHITEFFDENELRNLCVDLGVDYQSLEAVGKEGKARELVDYMRRQAQLIKLVQRCRELRPHVDW